MRKLMIIALLSTACAHTSQLADAKRAIMSADYRGDIPALEQLHDRVAAQPGYLAAYWAGYTQWRAAINGASRQMSQADLRSHLERAAAHFDESIRLRPDFADGWAAAASVNGWLITFNHDKSQIEKEETMLKRAVELGPRNPRVLWVQGGDAFYRPPSMGGDKNRAIAIWKDAVAAADAQHIDDPALPDWGKPEALMSLAFAMSDRSYAEQALQLAPEWWYVREVLIPQLSAKK